MDKRCCSNKGLERIFGKKYPKMFGDSSGTEMDVDVDTTMRAKPPIEREEKPRKVEEKLLSKRTNERFTDCDGVMIDPNLTPTQKILHLQKGIEDSTRRKIYYTSLQGELPENAFISQRTFMEKFWWKRRLQDGGLNFYENYTNLLWTTIKLHTALFL